MKLLLDENIPYSIKSELISMGYDNVHIGDIKKGMTDVEVSKYAIDNNRVIVSKDNHFRKMYLQNHVIFISNSIVNRCMSEEICNAISNIEKLKIEQPYKYTINKEEGILKYKKKNYSLKETEKRFKKGIKNG